MVNKLSNFQMHVDHFYDDGTMNRAAKSFRVKNVLSCFMCP